MTTERDTATKEQDVAQALADDDPQERAIDELVDYLSGAGIVTGGQQRLADLEASLHPDSVVDPAAVVSSRRRSARVHRSDEGADELEHAAHDISVRVAEDHLSATIDYLDERASLRRVAHALKRQHVRHGILVEKIKELVPRARNGEVMTDVTVAQGEPAVPGADAHFDWDIETTARAGTILEDGSIDLRDRQLLHVVAAGQRLGVLRPPREGTPGKDVFGKVLRPPAVRSLAVVPATQVRAEELEDGTTACFAEAEGGVTWEESTQKGRRRLRLAVSKISRIDQDVDYATGNIDFDGEVVISGSVKALFQVRATGSISIDGNVEAGARIEARGDVLVSGGIVGDETHIVAGGGLMCKFLQGCHVRAGGDIEVGAYVFEASLRCAGRLQVNGMGEGIGRALVGGLIWAGNGVETPSLGSPSNPRIRLILGVDPTRSDQAEQLRRRMRNVEGRQHESLKRLGLEHFDTAQIKRQLQQASDPTERAQIVQTVRELTKLGEALQHGRDRLAEIQAQQREGARNARLTVEGPVFPGPELRIGEHVLTIAEETRGRQYRLVEEDGDIVLREGEA